MDNDARRSWEEFLNPDVLRPRLITASLFITGFELLKKVIVGRIREFFCFGFDETGEIIDPRYQADVLSRNRSRVYASLAWLKDRGAVDYADGAAFDRVKVCRNHLAHDLLEIVGSKGMPPDVAERFEEMAALLHKIGVWWIREVDIPTNPHFDGHEVDETEIVPGSLIGLQLLRDIALGSEEHSRFYYDELKKRSEHRDA